MWAAGWPARTCLVALVRLYRLTLGRAIGGRCRFYPSCSAYAEEAIRNVGVIRGSALVGWRVLRCSPLSAGGVDHPPQPPRWRRRSGPALYDNNILRADQGLHATRLGAGR